MTEELTSQDVTVQAGKTSLEGFLTIPEEAQAIVIFAHGSGSSRFSTRNRFVAEVLNQAGIATLLFDLLTAEENEIDQRTRELRFNIGLLAQRLTATVDEISQWEQTRNLKIGLFGASTGAAAALITAAERDELVRAVVSRGGRPDLAGDALPDVQAPTLLIIGGYDDQVIELNRQAAEQMRAEKEIVIVPAATHLFEEPGKLEEAAQLACNWFIHYLTAGAQPGL